MKRTGILSVGLMALAMMASACSNSSNPTASTDGSTNIGTSSGEPGILAKLQDPEVGVQAIEPGGTRLLFTAGASGGPDSEPMRAVRIIESVEFQVRAPDNTLLGSETTRNVVTTGVAGPDNTASLTVLADALVNSIQPIEPGSQLIGIVRGRNGEVLVTRATIDVRRDT